MSQVKSVTLEVPEKLLPISRQEDYDPRKIKRWVDGLPIGHRGKTTKLLYHYLKHFNSVDIPVNDRFEIMQALAKPVEQTVHSLHRHLLNQSFPLTERSILTAEVVNELLANMVIGFRLIINARKEKSTIYQRVQQRMWVISLCQILHHVERIICVHRMLHFERPKGLWQGVHELYMETRDEGWHRMSIELAGTCTDSTTIENEYKKTLLVALISRHQVRGDQYEDEIIPLLYYWANLTELRAATKGLDEAVSYCIIPDADTPPMAMNTKGSRECGGSDKGVVLDTSTLRRYMLDLLRNGQDPISIENHQMSKDTLELLFDSWCKPHVRKEPRRKCVGSLAISIGLTHTNHIVSSRYEVESNDHDVSDIDSLENLRSVLAPLFDNGDASEQGSHQDIEITNIDYDADQLRRAGWAERSHRSGHAPLKADVINISAHGFCLSVVPPESEHVRNGDVIGIYNDKKDTWNLGQLVWLKGEPAHKLLMGVHVIATDILPVRLRVLGDNNQQSEALPALVGNDQQGDVIIVLPYIPAARQKRFIIDYLGHLAEVELDHRLTATPSFIAYKLITQDEGCFKEAEEEKAPLREKEASPLPRQVQTLSELDSLMQESEHDEYAHLWDKL